VPANVTERQIVKSAGFQRISFPFYNPAGGALFRFFGSSLRLLPNATEIVQGKWMINEGPEPAPYVLPLGSTVAITQPAVPSDPTTANDSLHDWEPRQYRRSDLPTTGVYLKGDIIWNAAPASGGVIGWVCTTGGVAGVGAVFKGFGAIA
jgi:hypothetical protein